MKIQPWLDEQWQSLLTTQNQHELLQHLVKAAKLLGFDHCSFVLRAPYPLTAPKALLMSNYPVVWQQNYQANNYIYQDPIMLHALCSTSPLRWSVEQFKSPFGEEALAHGIGYGWSQAHYNTQRFIGVFSLARTLESISANELTEKTPALSWLTQLAYAGFYAFMAPKLTMDLNIKLTEREKEVLRWTADGKTAGEIADILILSERTVHFHINNVLTKLNAANKTAATVQAVVLGLI
ncbi:autoinducer binding domain-containing protein [Methylobacter psychrophilus]|uniref:autoinducer binding domain-containing protein n=1 Tax=Methylobacter psychrophilus TaxID=96941 RepID=UPI0021D4FECF|nr:autoinducer binding domain-containing protein [Methylobacter psychrophilus]